jgi:hypothetical protein
MEDQPKRINPNDTGKPPAADRTTEPEVHRNPGLKHDNTSSDKGDEQQAIEETSEDRLSEAE